MKVIFVSSYDRLHDNRVVANRTKVERVVVIEDDSTTFGGRTIAKFWNRDDAFAVAKAMDWEVTNDLDDIEE